tara:strand:+ start:1118 stop:1300 length:183 start_codon:yes stop_codon:yes gene_type:complete
VIKVIVALGAIAALFVALLQYWTGPKATARRLRKAKDAAHKANAEKDGSALSDHFRKREL